MLPDNKRVSDVLLLVNDARDALFCLRDANAEGWSDKIKEEYIIVIQNRLARALEKISKE